jgi:hypothetical protein
MAQIQKNELTNNQINGLYCSLNDIADCNYYIILFLLQLIKIRFNSFIQINETVGKVWHVIYESTVYPG